MTAAGEAITDFCRVLAQVADRFDASAEVVASLSAKFGAVDEELGRFEEAQQDVVAAEAALERQQQEKKEENEERQFVAQVARILGSSVSGAALAKAADDLQRRVADIQAAQKQGILLRSEASETIEALEQEYAKLEKTARGQEIAGTPGRQLVEAAYKAPEVAMNAIKGQATGIMTGVMGLISRLPIAGGLFGLMMWGNAERDRLQSEAGEITNLVEAAGGTASRGVVGHLAAFQERAQKFYGISRQEVQGIVKTFTDAGLRVDDVFAVTHKELGEVGHDAMTLTLALDKHFEMASGTTARGATQLVVEHGLSLQRAVDQMLKLSFAGQRAGAGVGEFTEAALQAAGELKAYGIDAEQAAGLLLQVQEHFKGLGMSAGLAFSGAKAAMGEITQGIGGLHFTVKGHIAEMAGLGEGLEGRYALEDALATGRQGDLAVIVQTLATMSRKETEGTGGSFGSETNKRRTYLEDLGLGFEGARAIVALDGKMNFQDQVKELQTKEWTQIKDSLKTEAQKVSEIQKGLNQTLAGLAKMGQSMLVLLANFAALAIVGMKAMTSLDYTLEKGAVVAGKLVATLTQSGALGGMASDFVRAAGGLAGDDHKAMVRAVDAQFQLHWEAAAEAAAGIFEGGEETLGGMGHIVGPILKPVAKALRFRAADNAQADEVGEAIMGDEARINAALGTAGMGDDGVSQTRRRAGAPKVVNFALSKVGHHQKGDEASELSFGRREWWCMDFVGWAYEQAGFTAWGSFHKSMWTEEKYGAYRGIEAWARRTGNFHDAKSYIPQPGDVFFIERYSGETGVGFIGEHVGMIVDVNEDGTLLTVEGNAVQNGVNGVWQHRRDPSKTVFRGFISTPLSGRTRASSQAKSRYLAKVEGTLERKKKNQAKEKVRRTKLEAAQAEHIQKRAASEGRTYLAPEDMVSRAPEAGSVVAEATKATLVNTPSGPQVEVEIDTNALSRPDLFDLKKTVAPETP